MNNHSKLFRKVNEVILFDEAMIQTAKECFKDYVEKGIILTEKFEEDNGQQLMSILMLASFLT